MRSGRRVWCFRVGSARTFTIGQYRNYAAHKARTREYTVSHVWDVCASRIAQTLNGMGWNVIQISCPKNKIYLSKPNVGYARDGININTRCRTIGESFSRKHFPERKVFCGRRLCTEYIRANLYLKNVC